MRLIGLTGGIASGKSTVAALLSRRGAVVVDADALAHEVLLPDGLAFDDVVARFGREVLDKTGAVDRGALGDIVFADSELRADLERITHPRINTLMQKRLAAALDSDAPLVVADIPLLFERDLADAFDGTMLVYVPPALQLHRLRDRDGLDDISAQRRIVAQLPIDDKRARATWVIDNAGDIDATAAQVDAWWDALVADG
jgi:dephospho-CoA kinase